MALMKKLVEPGEPLDFGLYIEYKTKKVNETTKQIETSIKKAHIGSDQLWGDGVHWEAAVVGGNLGFGEVIADKVTIELITDKVDIDFNNFETGVIRELSFSKIGKNSPGYTGLLYDLLFIEDIQHRYDNQVIKITAYTTLKYLNQVVRTKELKTSRIATKNCERYKMENGNYGVTECPLVVRDLPDVVDILEDLEEKYLIPSFNKNYGYVGQIVTNRNLRDKELKEAGLVITRENINGSTERMVTLGNYTLESWRYYLDTEYVKDKDLTVKDLISMIAEKFGVFVRPKVYVQNKVVYVVFCYEWFEKDDLMEMTTALNGGFAIPTLAEECDYLKSLYHKPTVHLIEEYFSHNINPKKERLTSCVNIYEGVSGPWAYTTNFDEDLNQLNNATGVIETGKENHLSNTNHYKKNVAYALEDDNITLDKLYAIRAAKRFRNDALDYNYNELKHDINNGNDILEYYSGSIDVPLDVYIHPGDCVIVHIGDKYIPMLVGSVSAGSGGSMTIKSPPLKSFTTSDEYHDEYYNKSNLTSGGKGQDGKNGADGKEGKPGKSAYEIAVEYGFTGSQKDWLDSLKGSTADIDYNLVVKKVFEQMENAETGRH